MKFDNPVLRGFNPDPCLCRKGDDYYMATSTFEWYPGIRIFHSRNLQDWHLAANPLTSPDYMDLSRIPASGGIWAPDLSYNVHDGYFYLVYTVVTNFEKASSVDQGFKDCYNYVTRAKDIVGPWSKPCYLDSKGFDPSLFHDPCSGRSFYLSMLWNYRCAENNFAGIAITEFDCESMSLAGPFSIISQGTDIRTTEGPHMYARNGWYYLVMAEGGTSYLHSVTIQRSRNIAGPFENHPSTPFLSQVIDRDAIRKDMDHALKYCREGLQKTGHASFCPIDDDRWLMAFLCSRPEKETARCPLGRETALMTVSWKNDGWPWMDDDYKANLEFSPSGKDIEWKEDFSNGELSSEIQFLRNDISGSMKLDGDSLVLRGGESPASFNQILLGRRITEHRWTAETKMFFSPENFMQMAGLSIRYNEANQYYLAVSRNLSGRKVIAIHTFVQRKYSSQEKIIPESPSGIYLKAGCDGRWISFHFSYDGKNWIKVGSSYDFTFLSDDCFKPIGFTGSFIGLSCNDLERHQAQAKFDFLSYSTSFEG